MIAKMLDITRNEGADDHTCGYHTGLSAGFEYQAKMGRAEILATLCDE